MSDGTGSAGGKAPEERGYAVVQICIGSSCHLKGSARIVTRMQELIEEKHLGDDIILTGSFCTGCCNRDGVTIQVDDDVFVGITPDRFDAFFAENILPRIERKSPA